MDEVQKAPPPTRGVAIELDRTRYLRYTLGTLRKIRTELGEKALLEGVSDEKLAKVLLYGLQADDPSLTLEQVEDLIDMERLAEVVTALRKAMGGKANVTALDPPAPTPAASGASS